MAEQGPENVIEIIESDESEDYNPRLDFFSDQFDPLLALNTPNLKIPDAKVKRYDNLALLESALEKEKNPQKQQTKKKKPSQDVVVERKWLPHQLPTKSKGLANKKNIFSRMENMKGPLALLKKCRDRRLQVKVWTRNQKGIRGYCLGYVFAFDKHWNLGLEEVFEFWTRPKKRKVPAFDSVEENEKPTRRVRPPKVKVTPHEKDKKLENCTRKVDQFMMRGEHIVFIHVIDNNKE